MANKFGVQLKSTSRGDVCGTQDVPKLGQKGQDEGKAVAHLKSMFSTESGSISQQGLCLDYNKKTSSNGDGAKRNVKVKETLSAKSSLDGSSLPSGKTKGTLSAKSSVDGLSFSTGLSSSDQEAFKLLSQQLKKTGIEGLVQDDAAHKPVVAKTKQYEGSQTHQATVQTKETSWSGGSESTVLTKTTARSQLSSSLALLKVRPGSGGKGGSSSTEDPSSRVLAPSKDKESVESSANVLSKSLDVKSGSSLTTKLNGGPGSVSVGTKEKYIPGVPRGWKGSTATTSSSKVTESSTTSSKVSSSLPSSNIKTEVSTSSKLSSVSSTSRIGTSPGRQPSSDLKLSLGTRPGSPFSRQSSGENSPVSTGTSPRGYKADLQDKGNAGRPASPRSNQKGEVASITDRYVKNLNKPASSELSITSRYNALAAMSSEKTQDSGRSSPLTLKTDINRNVKNKRAEFAARVGEGANGTPAGRKKTAQEQLQEDKERFTKSRLSGSFSSDSEKGARSPKVRGQDGKFKWVEKGRISYEEFKQQHRESMKKEVARSSSTDSSLSSSSLNRSSDLGIRARAERFASPEPQHQSREKRFLQAVQGEGDIKRQTMISNRISPKKFEDIKMGFEHSPEREEKKPKPRLHIKTEKPLLERRESFENPASLLRQHSAERTVVSPQAPGKVLETIKSLNDLEAAAKAQPTVRRTQSLRKASVEDEDASSGSLYEELTYHDVDGVRMAEDGQSNEGDISSEADQIYEIISDVRGREGYSVRRNAVRKRKKASDEDSLGRPASTDSKPETGIEADIDSDTDSSRSSGIYEPIDRDIDEGVSQSDSADPEFNVPPPVPKWNSKKSKKKGDKSGGSGQQKGLTAKFKKLYRGKSSDPDLVKTASGAGQQPSAPPSGVLNKLGGKIKNLKKNKYSDSNLESQYKEEVADPESCPVCVSDSSDISAEYEVHAPGMEKPEEDSGTAPGAPPAPPPVPHRPPPLPPRDHNASSRNSSSSLGTSVPDGRVSPRLPPRNSSRISNNLDLNMVIPIAPGGTSASTGDLRKSGWHPGKDSYLYGQQLKASSATDLPFADESSSPDTGESPTRRPPSFHDNSTGRGHSPFHGVDSYVDVDPPPLDDSYSLADEIHQPRKELDRRPISSAYIKPTDLSTVPAPKSYAPFQDIMQYRAANEEDDILYMDLDDDQVYGKLGNRYQSKLETESLYQFYNKANISRASKRRTIYTSFGESDEEDYIEEEEEEERLYEDLSGYGKEETIPEKAADKSPSKVSTLEMFGKTGTVLRILWAEMPEVKDSGVLKTITPQERKIQESMFEIITSEATYLKSLNVLISVFLMSAEFSSDYSDSCVLTKQERHNIFSNIGTIRDASERFLADLESRWQKSVVLSNVCDIITKHATENFECYVRYCSNQTFQDRMVTQLKKKPEFVEALKRLESDTRCQGLPMISFLLLPMQRITRLPLLVDAICHRIDPATDKERHMCALKAQQALNKVVKRCNEGAKKMQQTEQMCLIAQQLEFKIKEIPLISSSRFLVKQGELTRVMGESKSKVFGKGKAGKQSLYLFLFSDIVLITKKRGNQYTVIDYAMRNALHVEAIDNPEKITRLLPNGVPGGCKHLFLLVMLENYDKKEMEMVFSCQSASDRARWLDAVTPVKVSEDQERIYEEWDCPQVQCIKKYKPEEPDELALEESDVINVFKKLDDGWYEGERMRDGERGWFPADHTEEILNSHVRARNLRLRYRMLRGTEDER